MRAALRKHKIDHHRICDLQTESQCTSICDIALTKLSKAAYDIYSQDGPWKDLSAAEHFQYTKQTRGATSGQLRFAPNQKVNIGVAFYAFSSF